MINFIKATEIWVPNKEKTELLFQSGIYGKNRELEAYSKAFVFKYDEGLPGKAWALKKPIILTSLEESYFKRTEIVTAVGLTCAIAMPIFSGEYLHAVVVFLCGDSQEHAGAIEVWKATEDRVNEMSLEEGYYGTMKDFAWISKNIKIMKGQGLPGVVWKNKMPLILKNLADSATFMRSKKATKEGISTALAIPTWLQEEDGYVMTFLSAKGTPIAKRFEMWVFDEPREHLVYSDGYSNGDVDLDTLYKDVLISKDDPVIGKTWRNGMPVLTEHYLPEYTPENYDAILTIPVILGGFCQSVIVFYY